MRSLQNDTVPLNFRVLLWDSEILLDQGPPDRICVIFNFSSDISTNFQSSYSLNFKCDIQEARRCLQVNFKALRTQQTILKSSQGVRFVPIRIVLCSSSSNRKRLSVELRFVSVRFVLIRFVQRMRFVQKGCFKEIMWIIRFVQRMRLVHIMFIRAKEYESYTDLSIRIVEYDSHRECDSYLNVRFVQAVLIKLLLFSTIRTLYDSYTQFCWIRTHYPADS